MLKTENFRQWLPRVNSARQENTYQAQVECPRDEGMSSLMMRSSILFVRGGGREVAAQRCRYLQQTISSKVHQRQLHLNTTHHRRYWPKQNQRESVLRSISSTSPGYLSSSPDTSFHGSMKSLSICQAFDASIYVFLKVFLIVRVGAL